MRSNNDGNVVVDNSVLLASANRGPPSSNG